jgi:hypothetical protein
MHTDLSQLSRSAEKAGRHLSATTVSRILGADKATPHWGRAAA